ncbi:hypothetical protein ACWDRR_20195, partial [Kitasatospora sp. NPDC003701]
MTSSTEHPSEAAAAVCAPPNGTAHTGRPTPALVVRPRRRRSGATLAGWLSVAPALLVILGFTFYPMVQSMLLSTD